MVVLSCDACGLNFDAKTLLASWNIDVSHLELQLSGNCLASKENLRKYIENEYGEWKRLCISTCEQSNEEVSATNNQDSNEEVSATNNQDSNEEVSATNNQDSNEEVSATNNQDSNEEVSATNNQDSNEEVSATNNQDSNEEVSATNNQGGIGSSRNVDEMLRKIILKEWRRKKSSAAKLVTSGSWRHYKKAAVSQSGNFEPLDSGKFLDEWLKILKRSGPPPKIPVRNCLHEEVQSFISAEDVKGVIEAMGSLPSSRSGPDKLGLEAFRELDPAHLASHFNLWILGERLPGPLLVARTVFVPKAASRFKHNDFRPITLTSLITKCLHRTLLAKEGFIAKDDRNPRQKGFKKGDGVTINVIILQTILEKYADSGLKLAFIDVKKAFDSVTHKSLYESASERKDFNVKVLRYLMDCYANQKTEISFRDKTETVKPSRGIRQGDPISPFLFNLVVNQALANLPCAEEIGIKVGKVCVNYLAYADDIVLMAESDDGLQTLIDKVSEGLRNVDLEINCEKSATLDIQAIRKQQEQGTFYVTEDAAKIEKLPKIEESQFVYLGVKLSIGSENEAGTICKDVLERKLDNLWSAPVPFGVQVEILSKHLLLGFYRQAGLTNILSSDLAKLDGMIMGSYQIKRRLRKRYGRHKDAGCAKFPKLKNQVPNFRDKALQKFREAAGADELMKEVESTEFFQILQKRLVDVCQMSDDKQT